MSLQYLLGHCVDIVNSLVSNLRAKAATATAAAAAANANANANANAAANATKK